MDRLRLITYGGALLAALTLGVFAYLLADAQGQDREEIERRFRDVAQVSAAVTDGLFRSSRHATEERAATRFGGPVDDAALQQFIEQGNVAYAAILDDRGRRLAATPDTPDSGEAVEVALDSGEARLSDVMGTGERAVVEWAIPYPGEGGGRVFVQGIPLTALADFLAASLGELPNFADAETVMLDSRGTVLGGSRLSTRVGARHEDRELLEAVVRDDHGKYGDDRYYAASPISGSPFRIVLATSRDDLYDSISGRAIPWIIFGAFALAALAGLFLLRRMSLTAAELQRRELNERHAVEINDNIIQGLALAKYQLQAGEGEASAAQVSETLREAQRLVSGLLGDAEVQAGQLRRGIAAETSRPDAPAEGD